MTRLSRLFRPLVPALALPLLLVACQKKSPQGGGAGKDTFKIAVIVPLTGPNAATGTEMKNAVELAVEEFNQGGGADGVKAELVARDDKGDAKEGVIAAKSVAQDTAVAGVVAHLNSGVFFPASKTYHQNGLAAVSPATTNPDITKQGFKEIFRVCTTDAVQGSLAAKFIAEELKGKKVSILHDSTQYGQGLAEQLKASAEELGLTVTGFSGVTVGEADYRGPLTDIARNQAPDVLYFGGLYDEGGKLVRQYRELGGKAVFMGGDGIMGKDFTDAGGESTEGAVVSLPGEPIESMAAAKNFLAAYEKKFGQPVQNYGPYAYDAANIVLHAAYETKNKRGAVTRQGVLAAVPAISHDGMIGKTAFDENGDTTNRLITFYKVEKGAFKPVKTLRP